MRRHYVTFRSPGTLFAEETTRPVKGWSAIKDAVAMAESIVERHGARPYGFFFSTRVEAPPVPDGEGGTLQVQPRTVETSGMFFLGGTLVTFDEITERRSDRAEILLSNMRCNGYPIVIETRNSCLATNPFEKGDCVVDAAGNVTISGADERWEKYRAEKMEQWKQELGL